jgi:hypothetical protein
VAAKGDEIALPMRIVQLAVDAAFQRLLGGAERVVCATSEKVGRTERCANRALVRAQPICVS